MLTREKPNLRANGAVPAAIGAWVRDILAEARSALAAGRTDAAAIHDYRKAMKRWRASLRLIEPFVGADGRRLRVESGELARSLARARDAQSALDALADLQKGEPGLSSASLAAIRTRLDEMRQAAEMTGLTPDTRAAMADYVDRAERAAGEWQLHKLGFSAVAGEIAKCYRRARRSVPSSWARAEAAELHALRKRVVALRYQMELIAPLWPRLGKLWIAEMQRLRDRLGHGQDLVLLTGLTEPRQPLARWRTRLAAPIAARRAQHVMAARRLSNRLFAERPKAFRRRIEALWAGQEDASQ